MSALTTTGPSLRSCRTCGEEKPSTEFYADRRYPNGDIHCASCRRAKVKEWRAANSVRAKEIQASSRNRNPDAARERARTWHRDNRDRHLAYMAERRRTQPHKIVSSKLKSAFGIDLNDYVELLKKQDGACAICGKTPNENGKRLAVDHCHSTGTVRGLLCSTCNQGIGLFKDNPSLLKSAISYIEGKP